MALHRFLATGAAAVAVTALAGCATDSSASTDTSETAAAGSEASTITVEHAFGTTEIEGTPERVATVQWANHDIPLALGVVPVGMAEANFGGAAVLPWVQDEIDALGGEPALFDETDGIDFEAVANTNPDVILAAYSGLTQEDYDTLSEIAPVVAYPTEPWATSWRDMITYNAAGMNRADDGAALIEDIEAQIAETVAEYPELDGKNAMFMSHIDTTDLSTVNFYSSNDPRTAFFGDLGLGEPATVAEASASGEFSGSVSAEQIDLLDDVDIIVAYGDQALVEALQADPLLSQMPAVENGAFVLLDGSQPIAAAINPSPLATPWALDEYVGLLAEAASKS
ncbi:iron-siderophore ABC transporter substrate-binding protein [Demequina sediminicola]|uniref:iron-siderophore ABC transporter substrate-binding protein n=1 Tax=Demequina sediminicola TaxID=1095026 RepID=UPI0007835E3E|nr:iron-siderophore ABC transporter substrate-binding protein [Demequina sediminicola]